MKRKYKYLIEPDDKSVKRKKIIKELIIWLVELLLVLGLAYFLATYMLERTVVVGTSMEPTLLEEDKILINKFAYKLKQPSRLDVIVYKQSNKEHSYYDIKRIIGLPGETVQIIDGKIYIDEVLLEDDLNLDTIINGGLGADGVTLDEEEYFVLGDNRNQSEDSRFANIGNINKSDIVGKAWIRLKPFDFIGELKNEPTLEEKIEEQEE